MILVDTSIWADHFRRPIQSLLDLIVGAEIIQHPFVTGELALGNPAGRARMMDMLDVLPPAMVIEHAALIEFIVSKAIGGTGIGFVDAHLLASTIAMNCHLWTRDRRLAEQAERLGLLYPG